MLLGHPLRLATRIDTQHVLGSIPKQIGRHAGRTLDAFGHQIAPRYFLFAFNLPGININLNPNNGTTSIAYYDYCDVTLSDSVAHLKTRTRYVIQLDGQKYRGGSTHCTLSGWKVTKHTLTDVPESLLIGGAPGTNGGELTRCWDGTLYQCKVYKGLLSDTKINKFIQEGTV